MENINSSDMGDSDDSDSESEDCVQLSKRDMKYFLRIDTKSFTFMKYIHKVANEINSVYPLFNKINFRRDLREYNTFICELREFLIELGCPYKKLLAEDLGKTIQRKQSRRLLLTFLSKKLADPKNVQVSILKENNAKKISQVISRPVYHWHNLLPVMPSGINDNQDKQKSEDKPKDKPEGTKPLEKPKGQYMGTVEEILVKLDVVIQGFQKYEEEQDKSKSVDTVPDEQENIRPIDNEQVLQVPQVVDSTTDKNKTTENKPGTQSNSYQSPQSAIQTSHQNNVSAFDPYSGPSQSGTSNNKNSQTPNTIEDGKMQSSTVKMGAKQGHSVSNGGLIGCKVADGSFQDSNGQNDRVEGDNKQSDAVKDGIVQGENVAPSNEQSNTVPGDTVPGVNVQKDEYQNRKKIKKSTQKYKSYRPPNYNQNQNSNLSHPHMIYSSQSNRSNQINWNNPINQNTQGIWTSQPQILNRNENYFEQRRIMQEAYQNRIVNDNVQYNFNPPWQGTHQNRGFNENSQYNLNPPWQGTHQNRGFNDHLQYNLNPPWQGAHQNRGVNDHLQYNLNPPWQGAHQNRGVNDHLQYNLNPPWQGAHQNRGVNDNIQQNLNPPWQGTHQNVGVNDNLQYNLNPPWQGARQNRGVHDNGQLNLNPPWQSTHQNRGVHDNGQLHLKPPWQGAHQNREVNDNAQRNINPPWQGGQQNGTVNDNMQHNLNPPWQGNRTAAYGHNQQSNLPQQGINYRQGVWNNRIGGNIPMHQNIRHGWYTQRDRMPKLGNHNNYQQGFRVQGGEYQNHPMSGNLRSNLNNQLSYRPAYGRNQNVNNPPPQGMYVSHGVGATYYITNISIVHTQEGWNCHIDNNDMGAFGGGIEITFNRGAHIQHRDHQNRSSSGQNHSHHAGQQYKPNQKSQDQDKNQKKGTEPKPNKF